MNEQEIRDRFANLNVWTRGEQRAPNKPLLVLYALGRLRQGDPRLIHFSNVNRDVRQLLIDFGPPRKAVHPEYPFWYLQNDEVWEVEDVNHLVQLKGKSDQPSKSILLQYDALGGFTPDVFKFFRTHPFMTQEIAGNLLESHFSESLHNDILKSVGLEFDAASGRTAKRDPDFRSRVLSAYEYRCAICGFDIRLETKTIGIEAAHIKWHQAGGPDTVNNGLALCTFSSQGL